MATPEEQDQRPGLNEAINRIVALGERGARLWDGSKEEWHLERGSRR